ncbi:MAG: helix-turn-helix transcriptional regulator [Pseudomonadota bacterium]
MRYQPVTGTQFAEIGNRLRIIRVAHDMTARAFAEFVGIAEQSYYQYERGIGGISFDGLRKIRERTGFTTDYLLTGDEGTLQVRHVQMIKDVLQGTE